MTMFPERQLGNLGKNCAQKSNLLIFWLKGNTMTHLMSLQEWVESQASGPLPHFWPSPAVTTFYERRVHGRTLPRANRAEAGTVADYWLTQIGVSLIEYLIAREEAPTTLLLRRAEYPPETTWPVSYTHLTLPTILRV